MTPTKGTMTPSQALSATTREEESPVASLPRNSSTKSKDEQESFTSPPPPPSSSLASLSSQSSPSSVHEHQIQKHNLPNGETFEAAMPRVYTRPEPVLSLPWKYITVKRVEANTTIKVAGYEKHRCDPDYVRMFHMSVSGMIGEFRHGIMNVYGELVRKLTTITTSPRGIQEGDWKTTLAKQYHWADVGLLALQLGLSKYNTFTVDMLAEDYLIEHVEGCVNHEMAVFLRKISKCNKFEVISKLIVLQGAGRGEIVGYDIVAKFDDDRYNHFFGTSRYEN